MKKIFFTLIIAFCCCTGFAFAQSASYVSDFDTAIEHILYDKISYNGSTLQVMLSDFEKRADFINNLPVEEKVKNSQKYLKEYDEMLGTISFYPETVCEELQPTLKKHNINIVPGAACDMYIYDLHIKDQGIPHSKDFEQFLKSVQNVYQKITVYKQNLLDIS